MRRHAVFVAMLVATPMHVWADDDTNNKDIVGHPTSATALPYDGYQYLLYIEGAEALGRGEFRRAYELFHSLAQLDPADPLAYREAGRAAFALGEFELAVTKLEKAFELQKKGPDPELHYLLGESLYALDRSAEARAEHAKAEQEIGKPDGRMATLWLARIHARRQELPAADALYGSLGTKPPAPPDNEVYLNRTEAHIFADDWAGAETILREFLERAPGHERGEAMLAWVLEARGKVEQERALRAKIAAKSSTDPVLIMHHARSLERSLHYREALDRYQEALRFAPKHEGRGELHAAVKRIKLRTSPEIGTGAVYRDDPSGSTRAMHIGVAFPIGALQSLSLTGTREWSKAAKTALVDAGWRVGAPSKLSAAFTLNVSYYDPRNDETLAKESATTFGGQVAVRTPNTKRMQLHVDAQLNMPWRESASSIREGGLVDAITGTVYGRLLGERIIASAGAQARNLTLAAREMGTSPKARQLLTIGGVDLLAWAARQNSARGEVLDERMTWPTYMADSLVLSYRHYEVFVDGNFGDRLVLVDRARIDELSATARKTVMDGMLAIELRGGAGYDTKRDVKMSRFGGMLWIAPLAAGRISLSYDVAAEGTTGLVGRRHEGWVSLHLDL